MVASAPLLAQKSGQSARITTGIVETVQPVELQSEAGKGVVVGGALGLLSAGGKSSSKKARNTIVGAAAGGALSASAQGSRQGMRYTVRATGSDTVIQVITDQTEIRQGDCVVVEEVGDTANLRRMAATVCDQASATAVQQLQDSFQQEATECLNAKQQLVEASTAEQLDLARRKMEILCAD
ncbi:MAG: hypothetical protein KDI05_08180 [Halieaceae bacterium]|nr:hypothetical protein [Halieaceae bacterium]MCP5165438.1 hypothetical protein [Pseudomonadales bacterium]MCP5205101.1 hypothetical protein [Pseudomonadales bacterium]